MTEIFRPSRRRLLQGAIAGAGVGLLAGCDALSGKPGFVDTLEMAESLNMRVQRLLTGDGLAREFPASMISPVFRPNGSTDPQTPEYLALRANDFSGYRLLLRGLVEKPLEFSLQAVRAMPSRTQITRHDCVEGWSCIGKWTGARLGPLLDQAGLKKNARYIVFHCADTLEETLDGSGQYYESIDLVDAYHPQTILAYAMNDAPLPVPYGAPVRLRVERQLGYKHAKYVMRVEAVADYSQIGRGNGGFWEDRGYEWYAGI